MLRYSPVSAQPRDLAAREFATHGHLTNLFGK